MRKNQLLAACAGALLGVLACGAGCGDNPSPGLGDDQTPPTAGHDNIEVWLMAGSYKSWHCEAAPHAPRSPSPHGDMNKICSNDLLSGGPATGEYPVGAASVKELYDPTGTMVTGYAAYVHSKPGTTSNTFYWYERVPPGSKISHDPTSNIVADGFGGGMAAPETACVSCHKLAGTDTTHFGHDYVYTQVH